MKIFQGIRSPDELPPLLAEGADEFYAGVYFEPECPLRSQYPAYESLTSREALLRALDIVHRANTKLWVAVNALYYGQDDLDVYPEAIDRLVDMGVDGIIVANLNLLVALAERNLPVGLCLSTLQPAFSGHSLAFFKRLKITRMVLAEQTGAFEAEDILKDPDIETEAFLRLVNDHFHTESFCLFHHRYPLYLNIDQETNFRFCAAQPEVAMPQGEVDPQMQQLVVSSYSLDRPYKINDVGNLYDLYHGGLDFLKIGGRRLEMPAKLASLRIARGCRELLENPRVSRDEFIEQANLLRGRQESAFTPKETSFWSHPSPKPDCGDASPCARHLPAPPPAAATGSKEREP